MKKLMGGLLLCVAPWVMADTDSQLYQAAGWSIQVDHFHEILVETQQQYQNKLPIMFYQALLMTSNKRFEPSAMKQRGEKALQEQLTNPQHALDFFNSTLGKKVVTAETMATTQAAIKKNKQGVPRIKISAARQALIQRLIKAIPYEQGAVDATNALANLAADSLESMAPGMGIGDAISQYAVPKKQIEQQVHEQLETVLIYVYRSLSDDELQRFAEFAESSAGKAYYQAALVVVNVSLNNK